MDPMHRSPTAAAAWRRAARGFARWRRRPQASLAAVADPHAEAGAPEGAQHVDGVPVGWAAPPAPRRRR